MCWYYYSLEFKNKVKSLIANGSIKKKTAQTKIYKETNHFLPCITDANLRKKIQRARKILKLFGKKGVVLLKLSRSHIVLLVFQD